MIHSMRCLRLKGSNLWRERKAGNTPLTVGVDAAATGAAWRQQQTKKRMKLVLFPDESKSSKYQRSGRPNQRKSQDLQPEMNQVLPVKSTNRRRGWW